VQSEVIVPYLALTIPQLLGTTVPDAYWAFNIFVQELDDTARRPTSRKNNGGYSSFHGELFEEASHHRGGCDLGRLQPFTTTPSGYRTKYCRTPVRLSAQNGSSTDRIRVIEDRSADRNQAQERTAAASSGP
jgi:hypothetical protein